MDCWIGSLLQIKLMRMSCRLFFAIQRLLCSVSVAVGLHLLPVIPGFFVENFEENTIKKAAHKHCC
jgi:hypothetical protein